VLGEVAHRLMTLEASARFGWPTKIVDRLKQNPATVQRLVHFRQEPPGQQSCKRLEGWFQNS